MMGSIKSYLNEHALHIKQFQVSPAKIAEIISLIDKSVISNTAARQKIFPLLIRNPDTDISKQVNNLGLHINADSQNIKKLAEEILAQNTHKVQEYQKGKKGLLGMFMGEMMKASQGKIDPKTASQILKSLLENS